MPENPERPGALSTLLSRLTPWRLSDDPASLAWHTRALYLDYVFNSAVGLFISLAIYFAWPGAPWPFLEGYMLVWIVYLAIRLGLGLVFSRKGAEMPIEALRRWGRLPVLLQAIDGIMLSVLCLVIYPKVDHLTQAAVMASVLVMVGSTALSLAWHWLAMMVYAPLVYGSLAWATWHLDHPYGKPFAAFTLFMFALYMFYVSNQRKTMNKGYELAQLNGQLAAQLQAKNAELQELAASRGRLLATVSHDLRQPTHAIGLLTEQALREPASTPFQETLSDLHGLSQSLSASLATLMDLTRLDAGQVQARLASVALGPLLESLQVEYAPSARQKTLGLHVSGSTAWVRSDPVLLHAMLGNLLANALKYTRSGQISIHAQEEAHEVRMVVEDTGIGIAPDQLETIFREFVRLDGSIPGTEGLGLGLSIVRRYASLLSHRIEVESTPGRGSRFTLLLERTTAEVPADHTAALPQASDSDGLKGMRLLVVDNVELVLKSVARTLEGWGCEVRTAECMVQALERQAQGPVDLVISDFHLGDREPDGLAVVARLRERHVGPKALPAILMTGDVAPELEARAAACGIRVLHKPVRPALLQRCILQSIP